MSNNKQSSVEWFWLNLTDDLIGDLPPKNIVKIYKLKEQAKAMHKKETIDFSLHCIMQNLIPSKAKINTISYIYDDLF